MRRGFQISIAIIAALAVILAYGYGQTYALRVTDDTVVSDQLPPGFSGAKIVFAADFHCGIFFGKGRMDEVVQKIDSLDPDIVILGGDYIESGSNYINQCFAALGKLKARLGVYAIMGNCDYQDGMAGDIRQAMADQNIKLLENSGVWIGQNLSADDLTSGRIRIGGIADILRSNPNLEGALGGAATSDFTILVAHNPAFRQIADPRIDLALAGHTHGGQITLFGLPLSPTLWGQKYVSGLYKKDRTTIIVSNGIGTRLVPIRLFAQPEINLITLQGKKS